MNSIDDDADVAASETDISQSRFNATESQLDALQALEDSLTCLLCQAVAQQPVSLGCGHFFCKICIDKYAENNWTCPKCSMSVSMTRNDGRPFFQPNPQLQTLLESLTNIKAALQQAPANWWTYQVPLTNAATTTKLDNTVFATSVTAMQDDTSVKSDDETDDEDDMDYQTATY